MPGTLDLLILRAIRDGELHGLGVARRIEQIAEGTFHVKPGSLFPALHRMEEAGWLRSFWGDSENHGGRNVTGAPKPASVSWESKPNSRRPFPRRLPRR
ncbi:MAG TPA: helix-turn-helix transcriptional regulator [Terriglobales bacterium]|nr:helix-turn-helix transcriptional regulator [Terriglobales bacterium]